MMYVVQAWCTEKSRRSWKPMGVAYNREQALGQVWLARHLLRSQGFEKCRMRIRPATLKQAKKRKGGKNNG